MAPFIYFVLLMLTVGTILWQSVRLIDKEMAKENEAMDKLLKQLKEDQLDRIERNAKNETNH